MSGQAIDITTLPVEQLGMIIKQLEEEIQILQTSFSQLKSARGAYTDTAEALESVTPKHKGKQLFVPITSSLYVRGRLSQVDTVLVDIGTGYFVQKVEKFYFEWSLLLTDWTRSQGIHSQKG
eukprot:TRINITY_DN2132_c0_g1_i11.p1 TRINITY_DN2132_c0_g1~~TRINITY_DN2132_c0_g1_i11.p1  ORF type:complete len:122 (-),score=12.42 TRINITY_DN2132_c0_g1_i11:266-631(-)